MKKKTLIILAIVALVAWYLWYRKKHANNVVENDGNEVAGGGSVFTTDVTPGVEPVKPTPTPIKPIPVPVQPKPVQPKPVPSPHDEPVVTKKTTVEKCPYCGTPGARVTRVYTGNKLTETIVMCGNKSCPGSYKLQAAKVTNLTKATKKNVVSKFVASR